MKIACQTITFGTPRHTGDIEGIIRAVREAGYDGMETGFQRLDPGSADLYAGLLKKYGLRLAALHVSADYRDAEGFAFQMRNLPATAAFAKKLGCANIFTSGSMPFGEVDYFLVAERLNALGAEYRRAGLALSYHNHDWEIKNNLFGLYTIHENTDAENLSFVPDVGWVTRGGADPRAVLSKLSGRISNLHFKEFTAGGGFAELGTGVVNFRNVCEFLKTEKDTESMWIVAEQDQSVIGAEESVRMNYDCIKTLLCR